MRPYSNEKAMKVVVMVSWRSWKLIMCLTSKVARACFADSVSDACHHTLSKAYLTASNSGTGHGRAPFFARCQKQAKAEIRTSVTRRCPPPSLRCSARKDIAALCGANVGVDNYGQHRNYVWPTGPPPGDKPREYAPAANAALCVFTSQTQMMRPSPSRG